MGIIFWSAFCLLGVRNVCVHSNLCCVTEFLMIRLSFNSWSRWQKAPDGETGLDFKTLILWGLQMDSDNAARNFKNFICILNRSAVTPNREKCAFRVSSFSFLACISFRWQMDHSMLSLRE